MAEPTKGVVIPATNLDRSRAHEDLAQLAECGAGFVRVGLDWQWTQPKADSANGDAVEFYSNLARTARSLGIELQFTLVERAVPRWFENEGGFGDAKSALHWWPRWVELCADSFGDSVSGFVPLEHPLGIANSLFADDPRRHGDVLDTLLVAWRDAWRILRGGVAVETAFGLKIERPVDATIPAEHAARRRDQIRWRLWLRALTDGIVTIPGRADREIAELAGACDRLGFLIADERDTLALLHRAVEMAPERPMSATYLLPSGADADRQPKVQTFVHQASEAASGMPLTAIAVSPPFDANDDVATLVDRGMISRDRELKDSARAYFGRDA